jgi:hypothetical protein
MLLIKSLKNMKKIIYVLTLSLVVVSGLVYSFVPFAYGPGADRGIKNDTGVSERAKQIPKKPTPKPLSAAESKAASKKWETTPDGIMYKKWKESPAGKKVYAGEAKIRKQINAFTNMEAVVTSLSLPPGSRLGYGVMIRIKGEDYILTLGTEKPGKDFLNSLKVNDKISIKSHSVSHAPKYSYPIISGDYVERDSKIIYKRTIRKDGC